MADKRLSGSCRLRRYPEKVEPTKNRLKVKCQNLWQKGVIMARITKDDWKAWNEERKRFAKRETQGFSGDIKALEQHIKTLREICPKDTAGYPHSTALTILNELQQRVDAAKEYLAGVVS